MGHPNPEWTEARIDRLTKLWDAGWPARRIAEAIGGGLTRNAVIGKVNRLRLRQRNNPGAERAIVKRKPSGAPRSRLSAEERSDRARERMRRLREARSLATRLCPAAARTAPPPPPVEPRMLSLLALGPAECSFPVGDPHDASFGFCGAPKWDGSRHYCQYHHRLCYRPAEKQKSKSQVGAVNFENPVDSMGFRGFVAA